jgi:LiaI-LiaF-like transmembrane region
MTEMNINPQPSATYPAPVPPSALPPPPPVAYGAPAVAAPHLKNPTTAGLLSFFPGLGHLYLGLYQRAFMFFGVWALIITFISNTRHGGALGVMIPFWWFFGLIDAVRQAKAINATGLPESNLIGAQEKPLPVSSSLAFGVFLILFGIFFLVDRLVTIDLSFLFDWWPLLLVGFGAWQVFTYYKSKQNKDIPL